MTTIYLPLPISAFYDDPLKRTFNRVLFDKKLEDYIDENHNLPFGASHQEALEIVNNLTPKPERPFVIVKYESSSKDCKSKNYKISDISCLKSSEYTNPPLYNVRSENAQWMLHGDIYFASFWKINPHVNNDLFLQVAGELRPEQHHLLNSIIELRKAFPDGEELLNRKINQYTYYLSCALSNEYISPEEKLTATNQFRQKCFNAIKSNGMNPICKNALKALVVFVNAAAAMVLVFSAFALAIYFAAPVVASLTVVGVMAGLLTGATTLSIAALATSVTAGLAAGAFATWGLFFKETPQEKAINNLIKSVGHYELGLKNDSDDCSHHVEPDDLGIPWN